MVSRTLAACSTWRTVLQLITFHQLEAFTGTVLLLDTPWNVGWFGGGGKGRTARWRMMFSSLLVLSQAHQLELRLLMLSYFLKNSQTTPTKGLGWETRDYSRYK
ncbi:hypothetical protein NC651_007151 [Populus alba x Populus x berolinensis]|nr:hypothetical protein NC651_007151 [Populus alba x Populus x berolinensis]